MCVLFYLSIMGLSYILKIVHYYYNIALNVLEVSSFPPLGTTYAVGSCTWDTSKNVMFTKLPDGIKNFGIDNICANISIFWCRKTAQASMRWILRLFSLGYRFVLWSANRYASVLQIWKEGTKNFGIDNIRANIAIFWVQKNASCSVRY